MHIYAESRCMKQTGTTPGLSLVAGFGVRGVGFMG